MTTVKLTGNFLATARCLIFSDGGGISWNFNQNTNVLTASATAGGTFLSSVGFADTSTAPIFTVSNSPLTVNGTINIALSNQNDNKVFAGPATGPAAQPTFRALTSADLPAGTTPTGANPATNVGLSVANGSAATFMRSDGAPALSQSIAPTWTGQHTFSPSSAVTAITVNGVAGTDHVVINAASGSSTDRCLDLVWAGHYNILNVFNDGHVTFGSASGTTLGLSAAGTGTFLGSLGINGNAAPAQTTGFGTPVGGAVVNNYNITDAGGANSNTNKCVAEILTILKAYGMIGT
jgi:hypothetical protein